MGISGPKDEQGQTPPMGPLSASDDAGTIDAPAGASFGRAARSPLPPSLAAGDMIDHNSRPDHDPPRLPAAQRQHGERCQHEPAMPPEEPAQSGKV